jgi:hypothetical protein
LRIALAERQGTLMNAGIFYVLLFTPWVAIGLAVIDIRGHIDKRCDEFEQSIVQLKRLIDAPH